MPARGPFPIDSVTYEPIDHSGFRPSWFQVCLMRWGSARLVQRMPLTGSTARFTGFAASTCSVKLVIARDLYTLATLRGLGGSGNFARRGANAEYSSGAATMIIPRMVE